MVDHMLEQAMEMEGVEKFLKGDSRVKTVVEGISVKEVTTKFGKKPTYSFKGADGQWYNMSFKKPTFVKGEEVEFEFESTRYGNNVTTVLSSHTGGTGATDTAPSPSVRTPWTGSKGFSGGGKGVFPIPATDGQRSIIRQNALTNARELYTAYVDMGATAVPRGIADMEAAAKNIIHIAKMFEHYAAGDYEATEAAKMSTTVEKK